jgi:aminotransferase
MESKISSVVRAVPFSMIREMGVRAAKYKNVISLGIGEPDFDTPQEICRQALEDALRGATHYTPSQGDPELIDAVCRDVHRQRGQSVSPRQVVITGGGMGALAAFFRAVLNPGDEVVVPEPFFPAYRSHIMWADGTAVFVPCRVENGFLPTLADIESAITPRTKVILLNSPNNPTGAVMPASFLDAVAGIAAARDLIVVSDEVYDKLIYDDLAHDSIYSRTGMEERTVVIQSFSKTYAMTGWRIGYAFGPEWLIEPVTKVVSSNTSCAPSISQRAALAALRMPPTVVDSMAKEFRQRRDLIYQGLNQIPGFRVHRPQGAFYILPDIQRLTIDTRRFAFDLLEQEQVVVVPGEAFGPSSKTCIRIAFTVRQDKLLEALERLDRFVRKNFRGSD